MRGWPGRIMMHGVVVALGIALCSLIDAVPVIATGIRVDAGASREIGAAALKGRYKKEGDSCVWDANDSGPNQCEPWTKGRFKKDGDRCVWSSSDNGPDQCTPPTGRFKKDGDRCVWTANDSGPNQCNPRQPR